MSEHEFVHEPFTWKDKALIAVVFVLLCFVGAITHEEPVGEKFQVTTKAGEVYEFNTVHYCGLYLRKAANQVFGAQDTLLNELSLELLPALVKDMTRIHEGHVEDPYRCKITQLEIELVSK